VPFIIGLAIGQIGYYIRPHLGDSEAFLHARQTARRATLRELFAHHSRDVLCGLSLVIAPTYYVMCGLALSIVAVACVPARRHADLDAMRKPA
jgi:hypothetical protein